MSINTYATLKTAIQNWSKRTDTLSVLDDFIDLTEADMWQNLRIRDMEARATASAPTDDRFLALPDNFLDIRKLSLISGNNHYPLQQRVPESINVCSSSGRPAQFAVTTQIEFDRTPNSAYTVEMNYYRQLTPLSSSNTSNAILTRFPNIYLYGSLFHFAQWAQNDAMLAKYSRLFDDEMRRANKLDRKGRHGPAPVMRAEGTTP